MKTALKGLLLASTALMATPALAQQQPTPPEYYTVDAQGVDLVRGTFNHSTVDVAIGPPGEGGIVHGRVWTNGGWRDTLAGTIAVSGNTYTVSFEGVSEVFTRAGSTGPFTSVANNGSTLAQTGSALTFTASDGTVAVYSTAYSGSTVAYAANSAALVSLQRPNGDRLDYAWEGVTYCRLRDLDGECTDYANATRLEGVASNRGFQVNFRYASDAVPEDFGEVTNEWLRRTGAIGINLAVDYCSPYDGACTGSRNWPQVTYVTSGAYGSFIDSVTDQSGRTTSYTYGSGGLTGVRLPGSTSDDVAVSYTAGKVSQVTSGIGTWNYSYVDAGNIRTTSATGPDSQSLTVSSDLNIGRATSATNAVGQTTSWQYAQGRVTRVTAPEGDYVQLAYDTRGNVTTTTQVAKPGSSLPNIVTTAAYPGSCTNVVTCNRPTSTTDARGFTTNYTWDPSHGGLTSVTAPAPSGSGDRPQTRYSYASRTAWFRNSPTSFAAGTAVTVPVAVSACASSMSCTGTADESLSTTAYPANGTPNNLQPLSLTNASGNLALNQVSTFTYTPNGDLATVDGPLPGAGDTTQYRYDDERQLIGVVGPDPDGGGALLNRATRYSYNPRGQVTLIEAGTTNGYTDPNWAAFSVLQRQETTYDGYGRPIAVRAQTAAGATQSLIQTSYDAAGRPDCTALRMNPASFSSPPASACTPGAAGSFGPDRISQTTYDAASRPISVTTGLGTADPITESLTYTLNGQTQTLTDGNGNVSTLEYDGFDRLVTLRYPLPNGGGSSTTDRQRWTYDPAGNIATYITRNNQTFTYTYDRLNRLSYSANPANVGDISYTYDLLSRPLTAVQPGVRTVSMTWDALGRQRAETTPLGTMAMDYDIANRRTRLTWPDGYLVDYTYDLTDAMTSLTSTGSAVVANYGYDNLGRRTSVTRGSGPSTAYGYDGVSRLTSLSHDLSGTTNDVSWSFSYNPAGQVASQTRDNDLYAWTQGSNGTTTYQPDGLNQIDVNNVPLPYDAKGNLLGDLTRTYTYDQANRLTSGGVSGGSTNTLTYDPLSRLFSITGTGAGSYLYDGSEIAGVVQNGTTTMVNRVVRGPWPDETVAVHPVTGQPTYTLLDPQNSTIALTGPTGAIQNRLAYDEYGIPQSTNTGRFQYTGQLWLPDAQVYHYKARAYHPVLGRFLQPDPIGYGDGMNIYAYVGGDPVNFVDPTGMAECKGSWVEDAIVTLPDGSKEVRKGFCLDAPTSSVQAPVGFLGWFAFGGASPGMGSGGGYGGYFGGDASEFSRGDVRNTPEYQRYEPLRQASFDRTEIYVQPIILLTPGGLPSRFGGRIGSAALRACSCFEAGTEVWTEDGLKAIEDIQVGDRLLSRDDETGQTAYRPVVELIHNQDRPIWEVTVALDDGASEVIATTDEHPWRTTDGRWVETDDLTLGLDLVTAGGAPVEVISVLATDRTADTYNFEVEGFHTYFVGESGVWVHNACTWITNVTRSIIPNFRVGMSEASFIRNLTSAGYRSTPVRPGVTMLSRPGSSTHYVMRNSNSFGRAADVYNNGRHTAKYGFE